MIFARLPWYVAGPLIGLFMIGLRATLNKPFGALGGYVDLAERALTSMRFGQGTLKRRSRLAAETSEVGAAAGL